MSKILSQLKTVVHDLNELNVQWALVGALAASIYSEPRTTRDIDVVIALKQKEEQESLLAQLIDRGYIKRQELMHLAPTWKLGVRLQVPSKEGITVPLDLLFSSTGIEAEIVKHAVSIEVFPETIIRTASLFHVLAMKILSQNDGDRIRDRADVQLLLTRAALDDVKRAKEALILIQSRGYSRGKNLEQELMEAIQKYAPQLLAL